MGIRFTPVGQLLVHFCRRVDELARFLGPLQDIVNLGPADGVSDTLHEEIHLKVSDHQRTQHPLNL